MNVIPKPCNDQTKRITWHFTTADARIKLRRLYPEFED